MFSFSVVDSAFQVAEILDMYAEALSRGAPSGRPAKMISIFTTTNPLC
jgi:hypothetical protein